jgi:hypothetical protein
MQALADPRPHHALRDDRDRDAHLASPPRGPLFVLVKRFLVTDQFQSHL